VDQPPPLERIGCTLVDLAAGMAALTFGMSAMARAVEFALDAGRAKQFEASQHMVASDVSEVTRGGLTHCAVRMRKRKNLEVLRGKDQRVLIAAGGRATSTPRFYSAAGCSGAGLLASPTHAPSSVTWTADRLLRRRSARR
jgi:hypothetical protein